MVVHWPLLWLTAWLCGWLVTTVVAAPEARHGRQRRIAWFHFEERPRNPNLLPEHWFAIGRTAKTSNPNFARYPLHRHLMVRSGFPRYCEVRFDTQYSTSGEHSFYLGLNGGSSGAFLEVGAIGAVRNSDYLITARLRTTNLVRARARLVAYFIDGEGRKIADSMADTMPLNTAGAWQNVSAKLLGDFPDVAWIGLQLELDQPDYDHEEPLGQHQVVLEEVSGGAWFDDIAIWQLPRLVVHSQSDVNIIRAPKRPRLSIQVVDMSGRDLNADLAVYDEHMNAVASMTQFVGPGEPSRWRWVPKLDRFGWYMIDIQVREPPGAAVEKKDTELIARSVSSLLWLPTEQQVGGGDADRFGLVAENLPEKHLELVPHLMDQADLDAIVLSAWRRDLQLAQVEKRQILMDNLMHRLMHRRRKVTLSLHPMPDELARVLDIQQGRTIDMFAHPSNAWNPYLAPVLMRHAQRIRHWQIGPVDHGNAFYHSDLASVVASMQQQLRNMAPDPLLVLPWSLHQSRREEIGEAVSFTIHVPQAVPPHRLGEYVERWTTNEPADFVLFMDVPPANEMTHERRINDLVLRMLYAWEAQVPGMRIRQPWAVSKKRHLTFFPDPLLGVFTTVAHRLSGRRVVGRLRLDYGLECMILDGPAGGMLVAWNQSADADHAEIAMYLGKEPVAIDVWGNRTPVPQNDGKHTWKLSKTPIFIEGIDPELARFRASFYLDSEFIESTQVIHKRTLTLANPWLRTISGHLVFTDPQQWVLQPQRTFFSIAAGGSTTIPMTLRFPVSELAGRKRLIARCEFVAMEKLLVDLTAGIEVGLRDVIFDANLSLETDDTTGRVDAVVTSLITNKGSKMLSLRAFAIMQGYPREMRPITGLRSGESVVRAFRFDDVGSTIGSASIRVGLRELAGPTLLNQRLTIDDL